MLNVEIDDDKLEEIENFVNSTESSDEIFIGSDSQVFRNKKKGYSKIRYSTAIVIRRIGNKGCKVFTVSNDENLPLDRDIDLFTRLMNETYMTYQIVEQLQDIIDDKKVELHLDLSEEEFNKSNMALGASRGILSSLGSDFQIVHKNNFWAATHVADHFCH